MTTQLQTNNFNLNESYLNLMNGDNTIAAISLDNLTGVTSNDTEMKVITSDNQFQVTMDKSKFQEMINALVKYYTDLDKDWNADNLDVNYLMNQYWSMRLDDKCTKYINKNIKLYR